MAPAGVPSLSPPAVRTARRLLDQLLRAHAVSGRVIAPAPPVFDEAGLVLRALRMAGRDIRRASLVGGLLQNFTIESWIKRRSTNQATLGPDGLGTLFAYGTDGYGFGVLNDGGLQLSKVGGSTVTSATSSSALAVSNSDSSTALASRSFSKRSSCRLLSFILASANRTLA